jgi:hypothetical protein
LGLSDGDRVLAVVLPPESAPAEERSTSAPVEATVVAVGELTDLGGIAVSLRGAGLGWVVDEIDPLIIQGIEEEVTAAEPRSRSTDHALDHRPRDRYDLEHDFPARSRGGRSGRVQRVLGRLRWDTNLGPQAQGLVTSSR